MHLEAARFLAKKHSCLCCTHISNLPVHLPAGFSKRLGMGFSSFDIPHLSQTVDFLQPHSPGKAVKIKLRYPLTLHIGPSSGTAFIYHFRLKKCLFGLGRRKVCEKTSLNLHIPTEIPTKAFVFQKEAPSTQYLFKSSLLPFMLYERWPHPEKGIKYLAGATAPPWPVTARRKARLKGSAEAFTEIVTHIHSPLSGFSFCLATRQG